MSGTGERFRRAGFKDPKPLIRVHGKPMVEYVIDFFPGEEDFLFICNKEQLKTTPLREILLRKKPRARIIDPDIPEGVKGPVATLIAGEEAIKDEEPIMVSYCDFNMVWDYEGLKRRVAEDPEIATASVCYTGFHPHLLGSNVYAGVLADEKGFVLDVREKHSFAENKIDGWHQCGVFYFKSGKLLKEYARRAVKEEEPIKGEHYVPHIFRVMLRDGLKSLVWPLKYFCQWGTPQDLEEYIAWEGAVKSADTFESIPDKRSLSEKIITASAPADLEKSFTYWKSYFS